MSSASLASAWTIPLGLTLLSIAGLVLALVCDGVIDVVAVSFVIVPLVVIVRQLARRSTAAASPPASRIP